VFEIRIELRPWYLWPSFSFLGFWRWLLFFKSAYFSQKTSSCFWTVFWIPTLMYKMFLVYELIIAMLSTKNWYNNLCYGYSLLHIWASLWIAPQGFNLVGTSTDKQVSGLESFVAKWLWIKLILHEINTLRRGWTTILCRNVSTYIKSEWVLFNNEILMKKTEITSKIIGENRRISM
jgi:hypothetical protein